MLLIGLVIAAAPAAVGATTLDCTSPSDLYSATAVGGGSYSVDTDEWNSTQAMCLSLDGGADFTVASSALTSATDDVTETGAPGAYPNIGYVPSASQLPAPVDALGDNLTSWSTNLASATGKYDVSYDIWYGNAAADCNDEATGTTPPHEMMIWINEGGGALPYPAPVSSSPTVTLQGKEYQVTGTDISSTHSIVNYYLTTPTTSVYDLDLRLFTADAATRIDPDGKTYVPTNGYLCSVQAGFEIWNGSGQQTTSFSYVPAPVAALPAGNITSAVPGMCLDAGGNTPNQSAASLPAEIEECAPAAGAGAAGQSWTVHNSGTLQMFGKCLEEPSTAAGSAIELDSCTYDSAQTWRLNGSQLQNTASGYCLTDPGSAAVQGTALQAGACAGSAGQSWREPYNGPSVGSAFTNSVSGDCLTNTGAGTASLGSCSSPPASAESWVVGSGGIVQSSGGECLDAVQGLTNSADPGDLVQVDACSGSATQQWLTTPADALMNPETGLCLDDPKSSKTLGSLIDTHACNGTTAQVWYWASVGD